MLITTTKFVLRFVMLLDVAVVDSRTGYIQGWRGLRLQSNPVIVAASQSTALAVHRNGKYRSSYVNV